MDIERRPGTDCALPPPGANMHAPLADQRSADHEGNPAPAAFWPLIGISLPMLLSSLGTSIANVALPTFAQTFAASFAAVQWIVLGYLLASTSLIVSAGCCSRASCCSRQPRSRAGSPPRSRC